MGQRKLFDLRFTVLIMVQIVCTGLVLGAMVLWSTTKTGTEKAEFYRSVAAKLHAAGVIEQASLYYEKYLESSPGDGDKRAKIAYSIGEMYEDQQKWDSALAWYYQVEQFDHKSTLKAEAGKRIVAILEKTKRLAAAKRELGSQTQLIKSNAPEGAVAVAQIGERQIYLHEVTEAMDALPEQYQQSFQSPGGKEAFLKKYVADELLYEKALRLNYNEDPKLAKQISQIEKQILVQKVIEEEVQGKVVADEADVKNYFEANRARYDIPDRANISLIKVKSQSQAKSLAEKIKTAEDFSKQAKVNSIDENTKDKGGLIAEEIRRGQGVRELSADLTDQVFDLKVGEISKPILSKGAYYLLRLNKKSNAKLASFDEIKQRVEFDYKMEKAKLGYQALIDETLTGAKVKIFTEKLN